MRGKFSIDIDKNIKEKNVVEYCLNLKCSGVNPILPLSLFALANRWHIDRLFYYVKLIENSQSSPKAN